MDEIIPYPIFLDRGDFCQVHSLEEQKDFGDCPVCQNLVWVGAESLLICTGHTLDEYEEVS